MLGQNGQWAAEGTLFSSAMETHRSRLLKSRVRVWNWGQETRSGTPDWHCQKSESRFSRFVGKTWLVVLAQLRTTSKRKSASSHDTRHLDVRVLHSPSAQQCFVLNGSEHHHYVKASHLASSDTGYENTCSAVLQPGSHEWLHLVPARSSTSPTTAALCSCTDHVWAFGVWLVEHPPAQ